MSTPRRSSPRGTKRTLFARNLQTVTLATAMPSPIALDKIIAKALNDAQISLATHKKCAKTLSLARADDPETFLPVFCNAILPVLLEYKVRVERERARFAVQIQRCFIFFLHHRRSAEDASSRRTNDCARTRRRSSATALERDGGVD